MSTKNCTPGKWYVEPSNPLIVSNDDYLIAKFIEKPVHGEAEANAELFAAAKETAAERDRLATEVETLKRQWAGRPGNFFIDVVGACRDSLKEMSRQIQCVQIDGVTYWPLSAEDDKLLVKSMYGDGVFAGPCTAERDALKALNAELVEACRDAVEAGNDGDWQSAERLLLSVISKATGEKQ